MTIQKIIDYVDRVKPNAFSPEEKVMWLNEVEGMVQTDVLLHSLSSLVRYAYSGKWQGSGVTFPSSDTVVFPEDVGFSPGGTLTLSGMQEHSANAVTKRKVLAVSCDGRTLTMEKGTFPDTDDIGDSGDILAVFDGSQTKLLVPPPYHKIYYTYLMAMIDFANGEYNKYQNTMALFNNFFTCFTRWYAQNFDPADGECLHRSSPVSAYAIALRHGFVGTETDFLASLRGNGIVSFERTEGDGTPGTTDTYTVVMSDGSSCTFEVHQGIDGIVTYHVDDALSADSSYPVENRVLTAVVAALEEMDENVLSLLQEHGADGDIHITSAERDSWNQVVNSGVVSDFEDHERNADIHITSAERRAWEQAANSSVASDLEDHENDATVHVTAAERSAWDRAANSSVASDLEDHENDATVHVTAAERAVWNQMADNSGSLELYDHVTNEDIHITSAERKAWDQAANSSVASDLEEHENDATVHITAAERAVWNQMADNSGSQEFHDHVTNQDIHVTAAEKTSWDNKADTNVATTSAKGLMSSADKAKLNGIAENATAVSVDSTLSAYSSNPVRNSAVTAALNGKLGTGDTAAAAEKWKTARTVLVDLGSTSADSLDGTEDITPGVSGTLPVNRGGTGATSAANALTNLGLTATAAELNYCDGVTSNIQTQLNGKVGSTHNHAAGDINSGTLPVNRGGTGATTFTSGYFLKGNGTNAVSAQSAQSARNAMGLGNTTGALPVANGGTGATTFTSGYFLKGNGTSAVSAQSAQAARNAMGLGNTTGALPVANGGTGATSAANALTNLGLTATAAELNYCDGVTSNIQTQLNGKAGSTHNHAAGDISSGTLPVNRGGTGADNGNTAARNLMERGSWTPTLKFTNGATFNVTYTTQYGTYLKVGDMVTVAWDLQFTATGTWLSKEDYVNVGSLPYTPEMDRWCGAAGTMNIPGFSYGSNGHSCYTRANLNAIAYRSGAGAAVSLKSSYTGTFYLRGSLTYKIS